VTLLDFDNETLQRDFFERPFAIRHNLVDHPLLQLDRIGELADSLEPGQVEHNMGDVPEVLPGGEAPKLDQEPGEIVRGIETNGAWIVLKRVETDPEYRALLDQTLDEVIPLVADRGGGATTKQAFIFLSAPNSTTPVHFDPEDNFLLQIRGPKEMNVAPWPSEELEHEEVTRYHGGGHRNISVKPEGGTAFRMGPGDGVYVPLHALHWVKTFDQPSISFSITFNTHHNESLIGTYSLNARLRKLGLSPKDPGARPGSDKAKAAVWNGLRRGKGAVLSLTSRNGR
jgi:hypothetical protein